MPTAMPSSVQGLTGGRGSPAPGSGLTRPLCPEIINYEFDAKDLVCLGLSSIVGVWYLLRKVRSQGPGEGTWGQRGQIADLTPPFLQHWIANNLFGLAFSLNGVELLHLNNVSTGCILLGGLFIYDVFWVSRAGTQRAPRCLLPVSLAPVAVIWWKARPRSGSSLGPLALICETMRGRTPPSATSPRCARCLPATLASSRWWPWQGTSFPMSSQQAN